MSLLSYFPSLSATDLCTNLRNFDTLENSIARYNLCRSICIQTCPRFRFVNQIGSFSDLPIFRIHTWYQWETIVAESEDDLLSMIKR